MSNIEFVNEISGLSFSNSLSSKSSLIDSLIPFPSFISCFVYSLSETSLSIYLDDIKDYIFDFVKKDQKYNVLFLLTQSLQSIKNNNIQLFKQLILEIQKVYDKIDKEKNSLLNNANLNENDIIFQNDGILKRIFNDVLLIRKIIPNKSNFNENEPNFVTYTTEDEAIKVINETLDKEPEKVKEIYDLFFFKNIAIISDKEFTIKFKYGFHFVINDILKDNQSPKEITLNDCFDYFYKKAKIYLPAEIMIIIIDNDDSNYKVKFEKEIHINLYDGKKLLYKFGGIIMEIDFQSKLIISESLDGKKWKKFNNINVDNIDINYKILSQPSILFYKKCNDI
jgi:hypothetical protein